MIHINVLFRADSEKSISKAVENDFSDSIIASTQIISQPHDSTQAILVDANKLFIRDISYISQRAKGRYIFDQKIVHIYSIDSFDSNIELEISTYYRSKKSTDSYTFQTRMEMKYHISIMELLQMILFQDLLMIVLDIFLLYIKIIPIRCKNHNM